MTQHQLDRSVARTTGESLRTVRGLGFQLLGRRRPGLEPEDLHLAVDCGHCGRACPLPAGGLPAMAECDHCDIYFDYRTDDIYAAADPESRRDGVAA